MEIVVAKVDDMPAMLVRYERLVDAPFRRHEPIEDRRAGPDFKALEWDPLRNQIKRPTDTVSREAATYREHLRHEPNGIASETACDIGLDEALQQHFPS